MVFKEFMNYFNPLLWLFQTNKASATEIIATPTQKYFAMVKSQVEIFSTVDLPFSII